MKHQFATPLGADLFALMADMTRPTQQQLAEAYEGIPLIPTPEDINRMAAIEEERFTEGRIHRHNFRQSPHGD